MSSQIQLSSSVSEFISYLLQRSKVHAQSCVLGLFGVGHNLATSCFHGIVNIVGNVSVNVLYSIVYIPCRAFSDTYMRSASDTHSTAQCTQRTSQMINAEIRIRSEEENTERYNAVLAADYALRKCGRFKLKYDYSDGPSMDWGSRMQKYWMLVEHVARTPDDQYLLPVLTIAPISRHCPLLEDDEETGEKTLKKKTVKTLNELIGVLQLHPYIHPFLSMSDGKSEMIYYLQDRKQVVMIQENTRSLKDIIHKVEFTEEGQDWADKYIPKLSKPTPKPWSHYFYIFVRLMTGITLFSFVIACCLRSAKAVIKIGCDVVLRTAELVRSKCSALLNAQPKEIVQLMSKMPNFLPWRPIVSLLPSCVFGMFSLLRPSKKLPATPNVEMALYGRQILEAMMFLYEQGFPVLGHVQSGNIFVKDGVCRLGGYENTLLGYKSRLYRMCRDHLEHMDVIMLGHLVFEMCCGYELTTLVPTAKDYQAVRNVEGGEEIEEVLKLIFENFEPSATASHHEPLQADAMPSNMERIKKILDLPFFQSVTLSPINMNQIQLDNKMKSLLAKVRGDSGGGEQEGGEHKLKHGGARGATRRKRAIKCPVS